MSIQTKYSKVEAKRLEPDSISTVNIVMLQLVEASVYTVYRSFHSWHAVWIQGGKVLVQPSVLNTSAK